MTNLANLPPMGLKTPRETRFGTEERRYFQWLHQLNCCLTGNPYGLEIAHTGDLRHGKGMGRKANLNTCLPMVQRLHIAEERGRAAFWRGVGIDPIPWAERLHDIYTTGQDIVEAEVLLRDMQDRADRTFLAALLTEPTPASEVYGSTGRFTKTR